MILHFLGCVSVCAEIKSLLVFQCQVVQVGRGCLHADFANKSLGGGVLVGGCVQEEYLGY